MTRALVTQLVEALEGLANTHQQGRSVASEGAFGYVEMHVQNAEGAITAAREYLAAEPKPTLTEALAQQGIKLRTEFEPKQRDSELATEPSGELAQSVEPYGWMVSGTPTVMRGSMAQAIQEQEAKRIGGACKAFPVYTAPQQAKRVPMSADNIYQLAQRGAVNDGLTAIARAIEAHHGITPAEKPTVDEPEEEDLYALALKADNWGQP